MTSQHKGRRSVLVSTLSLGIVVGASASLSWGAPAPAVTAKPVVCPASPGVDGSSINLGIITATSGASSSSFTGFVEGATLRVDQQNAKGGVNGRKIKLTTYDDQGSGATQSSVATKAIQQDNQFGVIEASTVDTMMPVFKASNVPVVGLTNLPAHGTDRNVFGVTGAFSNAYTTTTLAKRLTSSGATKVAIVNHNSPGAQSAGGGMTAALALENIPLALRISDAPIGAYDATSTALRIKQSGADAVNAILTLDGAVSLIQALTQQGVKLKAFVPSGLSDPAVVAKAPAALEGAVGSTFGTVPVGVPGKPGLRTFANGMKAAGRNPYSVGAPIGFVAADTFIKGLQLAGKCPTREGFVSNLRKQTNITGAGMLPEAISYAPGLTPNGNPGHCSWYMTVQGGQFVPDAAPVCGKIIEVATGKIVG